jgi:hypothetical protein
MFKTDEFNRHSWDIWSKDQYPKEYKLQISMMQAFEKAFIQIDHNWGFKFANIISWCYNFVQLNPLIDKFEPNRYVIFVVKDKNVIHAVNCRYRKEIGDKMLRFSGYSLIVWYGTCETYRCYEPVNQKSIFAAHKRISEFSLRGI